MRCSENEIYYPGCKYFVIYTKTVFLPHPPKEAN